jgi:hypothetical protein
MQLVSVLCCILLQRVYWEFLGLFLSGHALSEVRGGMTFCLRVASGSEEGMSCEVDCIAGQECLINGKIEG